MHVVCYYKIADSWKSHMTLYPMMTFFMYSGLKAELFQKYLAFNFSLN